MTRATLARDEAVPRRDALLDGAAVARALGVRRCERTYAKYRVGESLRVVHRTDDGAHVAGRSFADAAAAYARALPAAAPVGSRPGVVHAPELDAVLWTFPNDRRIAALAAARRPEPGARPAGRSALRGDAPRRLRRRALGHRGVPGREREVVAFAKVHAGDGAARERRATAAVGAALGAGSAWLRVPRLLGGDGAALALEALPGRRLDTLAPARAARRAGAARRRARHAARAGRRRAARASSGSSRTAWPARSARSPPPSPPPAAPRRSCSPRCSAAAPTRPARRSACTATRTRATRCSTATA